ncbi:MAG: hypothetical protein AAF809_12145 [Bacteroidota bacterium]
MNAIVASPATAAPVKGAVDSVRFSEEGVVVAIQDALVVAVLLLLVVLLLP